MPESDERPVEVEWIDSANLFGDRWAKREELDEHTTPMSCFTVGYVVLENDHSLYLAGSRNEYEIGSVMQIPLAAILNRRELS